jgi:hypothetical protein
MANDATWLVRDIDAILERSYIEHDPNEGNFVLPVSVHHALLDARHLVLRMSGQLDGIRDALLNGADERLWRSGESLPEAVSRLVDEI